MGATDEPVTIIRRDVGAPLHHQISTVLRSAINSGRYGAGDYLPGENALMEMYGVSRATVRRALESLEDEGLIDRLPGKGTVVLEAALNLPMDDHLQVIERGGRDTVVELLEFRVVPAPREATHALDLAEGARVLKIVRLRRSADDRKPLRHVTSFVPLDIAEHLTREMLEHLALVIALDKVGHRVDRAEDEVGATLADPLLAGALDVRVGDPLLEMVRIVHDQERRPLALQRTVIPPQRFKLRILVHGHRHGPAPIAEIGGFVPLDEMLTSSEHTKGGGNE